MSHSSSAKGSLAYAMSFSRLSHETCDSRSLCSSSTSAKFASESSDLKLLSELESLKDIFLWILVVLVSRSLKMISPFSLLGHLLMSSRHMSSFGDVTTTFVPSSHNNPLPFYIPFLTEKVPLQYTFYWHWYPFHNPSLELCILLNCCKCTVFKIWINHKTRPFTLLFSQLWYICKPFLGFLPTEMTVFPILSYTSASEIPNLSYTWGLKMVPLPGGASPYRPF